MPTRFSATGAALALLIIPALVASPVAAGRQVEIVRVWTAFRTAELFVDLSAYLHGEPTPEAIVVRSQPDHPEGLYFTIRVSSESGPLVQGKLRLRVIAPDGDEPRVFDFPVDPEGRKSVQIEAGLTGTDWTWAEALPLAWRLEYVNDAGSVVASRDSFLWTMPADRSG